MKQVKCTFCNGTGIREVPEENFYMAFVGQRIKEIRESKGMTQQELSDKVELARTSIANLERGSQNIPFNKLFQIAEVLNIGVQELIPQVSK